MLYASTDNVVINVATRVSLDEGEWCYLVLMLPDATGCWFTLVSDHLDSSLPLLLVSSAWDCLNTDDTDSIILLAIPGTDGWIARWIVIECWKERLVN